MNSETKEVEEWRPIPCMPYEASSWGRIRRYKRAKGGVVDKILKPYVDRKGYLNRMVILDDGSRLATGIHRLVCLAFHGSPPFDGAQAAHGDGNHLNNTPGNLRWATPKENSADARKHGTIPLGSKNHRAKLKEEDVIRIRLAVTAAPKGKKYETLRMLAAEYGMSHRSLDGARTGKTWKWLSEGLVAK